MTAASGYDFDAAYPPPLRRAEAQLVRERRQRKREEEREEKRDSDSSSTGRLIGFGLSGGGIRSATFCLGFFQGMAAKSGLISQIDFLSTVSGGGYFGSFFGRLLSRRYINSSQDAEAVLRGDKHPEVLRFLRENGRYLSPNGGGDKLLFGAAILRNLVAIHLVIATLLIAGFLGQQYVRWGVDLLLKRMQPLMQPWIAGSIWWSPLLLLPTLVFVVAVFPLGWAYWMVEDEREVIKEGAPKPAGASTPSRGQAAISPLAGLGFAVLVAAAAAVATRSQPIARAWAVLAGIGVLTLLWWVAARWAVNLLREQQQRLPALAPTPGPEAAAPPPRPADPRADEMDAALHKSLSERNRLGLWLTTSLVIAFALLVAAVVDSLGQTLWVAIKGHAVGTWFAALASSLAVFGAVAQRVAVYFSKGAGSKRPSLPLNLLASVAAIVVVGALLVGLNAASHAIAWKLGMPVGFDRLMAEWKEPGRPAVGERDAGVLFLAFSATALLSILFGQTWPFVNRSTQLPTYGARLTRAYLGASNPRRWEGNNVTTPLKGDDLDLARYWPPPECNGSPIHLLNVTINETIDGDSQVQQQDRKGLGMALGPCGISAGVRHHALMPLGVSTDPDGIRVDVYPKDGHQIFRYGEKRFRGEMLPLGAWLSISGAAFSTGTGMRTSLGLSLLAGLGNVRLGRWWDAGVGSPTPPNELASRRKWSLRLEDTMARLFPVQTYMIDEMLARFPGTARRHWYLSDGGHFENLGGYELIRRRLPFIVIVDAEMDVGYTFEGLANLIRKSRLDFGAEIEFLDTDGLREELGSPPDWLGTLHQLRRGRWKDRELVEEDVNGVSKAHAALARVSYPSSSATSPSWLLYVKPSLTGDEPSDIVEYHRGHEQFPHEPTSDQFFDEAQWESYRKLGEHIATRAFVGLGQLVGDDGRPWLLKPQEQPEGKPSTA